MKTIKINSAAKRVTELIVISCIDLFSLFCFFHLAVFFRLGLSRIFQQSFPPELPMEGYSHNWWIFAVWFFFFHYEGLYTKFFSFWDEIQVLFKISFLSTAGIFAIASVGKTSDEISRTVIVLMGIVSIILFPFIRIGTKQILRLAGLLKRRVLVLGAGKTGKLIVNALISEPNYGFEIKGFVDDNPKIIGTKINGITVHGGVRNAVRYVKKGNIQTVIVAMPGLGKEGLKKLVNDLQFKVENLLFVPDVFGIAVLGTSLHQFFNEGAFAFEMKNNLSNPFNTIAKKCFDIFLSILLLPFLFLAMAMFTVLIKIDSDGPALFRHERIGKGGRKFKCFKFRTMHMRSEEILSDLLSNDRRINKEWHSHHKIKNDPRITRVGRFLRNTSLDELPQIINILKGEMSLVGPRPVTQDEIDTYYMNNAKLCFSVPPGITGLWQVSGRSDMNYDRRILLDSWYVRNWNIWLDIVILFKTVGVVIKRKGAW